MRLGKPHPDSSVTLLRIWYPLLEIVGSMIVWGALSRSLVVWGKLGRGLEILGIVVIVWFVG